MCVHVYKCPIQRMIDFICALFICVYDFFLGVYSGMVLCLSKFYVHMECNETVFSVHE